MCDAYESQNCNVLHVDIRFNHTQLAYAWNGEKLVSVRYEPIMKNVTEVEFDEWEWVTPYTDPFYRENDW